MPSQSRQNIPQTQVAPTDYLGVVNTNYQGQLANYNAARQQNNAGLGGLFGVGGTLLGGALGSPWLGGMLGSAAGGADGGGFWD